MDLEVKEIDLSEDDVVKLSGIDSAIRTRSLEFAQMALEIRAKENQISDLYNIRNSLIENKIQGNGINIADVVKTTVSPSGDLAKISVMVKKNLT